MADTTTTITRACATGQHHQCPRRVALPEPDPDTGNIYTPCKCTTCNHIPDLRRRPRTKTT